MLGIAQPIHLVAPTPFWIDRTEVTNAQCRRHCASGAWRTSSADDDPGLNDDHQLAVGVS